ncbi:helix-turn-helix transcriptional regulator [Streptomyces sp. B29(2018)]|uniref:helix-turn-helix domain-containing protein n=1 Tax=Streptomyces sp. B29(2018) TaxID=2485016 RepID=UPI000FD65AF0|nr:helix-turn-helix transcriptional regulator [Streptomyces sp. B29(2018)]
MPNRCENCNQLLPGSAPEGKLGRPAKYCSTNCRQAAHRARKRAEEAGTLRPPKTTRRPAQSKHQEAAEEILFDVIEGARELLHILPSAPGPDLLHRAAHMREGLDALTAGLVGHGRAQGMTWAQVSAGLGISEDTARHRYAEAAIMRRLSRFVSPRPAAVEPSPPAQPSTSTPMREITGPDDPRPAISRLAPILSLLARKSPLPLKRIAERMGCSPSYLSRVLSGERVPTWPLTVKFARACGADPQVLRKVWETERLQHQEPVDPVLVDDPELTPLAKYLTALRTLHIQAGAPSTHELVVASRWKLTTTDITSVLEGKSVSEQTLLQRVVLLLGGDVDMFELLRSEAEKQHPRRSPGTWHFG